MIKKLVMGERTREVIFQISIHILVFIFYTFNRNQTHIEEHQIVFFLTYATAALVINYLLLPHFYYQKKYWIFSLGLLVTIASLILLEELVIEKIYFPDTRGSRFPGLIATLWGILPVLTFLCGFKFAWDALGKQRELDSLKELMRESELQFLKTQINPHFLFNNLNNLYSYALENSPKTTEIIVELSAVLRYMLYECQEKYVPLVKEVKQLENFISLSEMQIEERGEVRFSKSNISGHHKIAPLILMVFVENAFKHSTASQSDDISIDMSLKMDDNKLTFICKNSYLKQSNTQNLSNGIGLENVKKRLDLLYPNAYKLILNDKNDVFVVRLILELTS